MFSWLLISIFSRNYYQSLNAIIMLIFARLYPIWYFIKEIFRNRRNFCYIFTPWIPPINIESNWDFHYFFQSFFRYLFTFKQVYICIFNNLIKLFNVILNLFKSIIIVIQLNQIIFLILLIFLFRNINYFKFTISF